MYHLFLNPGKTGIFNLGTGKARSWNDLANAMFAALGKKPFIEYVEMPESLRDKYQYFTEADMNWISEKDRGFDFEFRSLEDSVKDYIGYLKKNAYL
jgi:ADP-L-glycero-D-manno-heptose 6-epimerase